MTRLAHLVSQVILAGLLRRELSSAFLLYHPGDDVQEAIDNADDDDVITLEAGEYPDQIRIDDSHAKNLTIVGAGSGQDPASSTTLKQPDDGSGGNKQIHIYGAEGLTLKDFVVVGDPQATGGQRATGIDATSVSNLTLDNIKVFYFVKNGIAINSKYVDGDTPSNGITFNDVESVDNGWAGIVFSTRNNAQDPNDVVHGPISNVVFTGETHIVGTDYGIQFGDDGDPATPGDFNDDAVTIPATPTTVTLEPATATIDHGDRVEFTGTVNPAPPVGFLNYFVNGEQMNHVDMGVIEAPSAST